MIDRGEIETLFRRIDAGMPTLGVDGAGVQPAMPPTDAPGADRDGQPGPLERMFRRTAQAENGPMPRSVPAPPPLKVPPRKAEPSRAAPFAPPPLKTPAARRPVPVAAPAPDGAVTIEPKLRQWAELDVQPARLFERLGVR